jgi:uncharacterized membrane protein
VDSRSTRGGTHLASIRVVTVLAVGVLTAVVIWVVGSWDFALLVGWLAAALTYTVWVWARIGRMGAEETRIHATREDPSRPLADALLVIASVASLGIVAFVLLQSSPRGDVGSAIIAGLAIASVAFSWALIHTLFTLRYASLYYRGEPGGVNFNQNDPPDYGDFAYLSFTLGMTYQVSDTALGSRAFRMTALRHALLSYLFGAVILATIINLLAGLGGSA